MDFDKLAAFLKRVTPGVIEVLDEVYGSNAFEGYNPGASGEPAARVNLLSSLRILDETNKAVIITILQEGLIDYFPWFMLIYFFLPLLLCSNNRSQSNEFILVVL